LVSRVSDSDSVLAVASGRQKMLWLPRSQTSSAAKYSVRESEYPKKARVRRLPGTGTPNWSEPPVRRRRPLPKLHEAVARAEERDAAGVARPPERRVAVRRLQRAAPVADLGAQVRLLPLAEEVGLLEAEEPRDPAAVAPVGPAPEHGAEVDAPGLLLVHVEDDVHHAQLRRGWMSGAGIGTSKKPRPAMLW
jgi:hypothetical protein